MILTRRNRACVVLQSLSPSQSSDVMYLSIAYVRFSLSQTMPLPGDAYRHCAGEFIVRHCSSTSPLVVSESEVGGRLSSHAECTYPAVQHFCEILRCNSAIELLQTRLLKQSNVLGMHRAVHITPNGGVPLNRISWESQRGLLEGV